MVITELLCQLLSETPASGDLLDDCCKSLNNFNKQNEKTFDFAFIYSQRYDELMNLVSDRLPSTQHELKLHLLTFLRLLSRDKKIVVNTKNTASFIDALIDTFEHKEDEPDTACIEVECLKCICNWIYHSEQARKHAVQRQFFKKMVKNLKPGVIDESVYFQIRLIFLISALDTTERSNMMEYGTLTTLVDTAKHVLRECQEREESEKMLTELLKAIFNLTYEVSKVTSEQVLKDCKQIGSIARILLLKFQPFEHTSPNELLTHTANMLINLPAEACAMLITPALVGEQVEVNGDNNNSVFEGHDMCAVDVLLQALETRSNFKQYSLMKEKTLTILVTFSYVCRLNRTIRKYLKHTILPRLKTSEVRPEEQTGIRGRIIMLMQDVDTSLKNMAADFLFVLCKENSDRLVRYVGFGNAAGFLSSRGLMAPSMMRNVDGDYSDDEDSECSDDDDKDPVTGAKAVPKVDAFENMTEEEKEKEIDNLISMTNRLRELDVIKPMAVRSDGTLVDPLTGQVHQQ